MSDDDRDVADVLADMARELEPLHAVMASFRQGGDGCARCVERIHDRLIDLARRARGLEVTAGSDDDDDDDDDEGPWP